MMRSSGTCAVPNVSTYSPTGRGLADRVGDLHLEAVGEPGRDGVLGDPAHRVRGGAVDLRRVLAAERAAAVPGRAAVGVDDDLAAGEAGVALRAADLEAAGRVDEDCERRPTASSTVLEHRTDHELARPRRGAASVETSGECCVDSTTVSTVRGIVPVVADRDLGLAVGPQEVELARLGAPRRGARRGGARARSARGMSSGVSLVA